MVVHSFHLAVLPTATTAAALIRPPSAVAGLRHCEAMVMMQLGAPTLSPTRMQLRRMAFFAEWDDDAAIDRFLADHPLGSRLETGWHLRLSFLRRWGTISVLPDLPKHAEATDLDDPVVAVTLARMRLPQLPRFLRWGKPVERLVRDHPGATLALAAMRPPRTVCTFSVWRSAREMIDMVHGRSAVPEASRHVAAMRERERRDFHHEFTTLRFRPLSEHGQWQDRKNIVDPR